MVHPSNRRQGPTCIVHAAAKDDVFLHDNAANEIEFIFRRQTSGQMSKSPCVARSTSPEDASASTTDVIDVRDRTAALRPRQNVGSGRTLAEVVASSNKFASPYPDQWRIQSWSQGGFQ